MLDGERSLLAGGLRPRRDIMPSVPRALSAIGWLLLLAAVLDPHVAAASNQSFEDDRCTECHRSKTARSHPTGIVPPVADASLVLTADGTIGCVTCHFAHDVLPDGMGAREIRLRTRCRSCHPSGLGHDRQRELVHELRDTPDGRVALAQQTRSCITCHDGTAGPDTHVNDGPRMFSEQNQIFTAAGDAPQLGRSHPILVDYQSVAQDNSHGYRSELEMSPIIQFEDGEVGCLSCHDLFNSAQAERLVQSNVRSALCLQCHNLSPSTTTAGASPTLLALARQGVLMPFRARRMLAAR